MSYTQTNFKTKKALRLAISNDQGCPVRLLPDVLGISSPTYTGVAWLEGPHSPQPHTWYAQVEVVNGIVTKIIS